MLDLQEVQHRGHDRVTARDIPAAQINLAAMREEELAQAVKDYEQSFGTDGGKKSRKRKSRKRKSRKRKSRKRNLEKENLEEANIRVIVTKN